MRRLRVLAAALLVEALVGYPDAVFRRAGHPVSWAGWLIGWMDGRLNDPGLGEGVRRGRGVSAVGLLVLAAWLAGRLVPRGVPTVLAASSLLAARGLHTHVAAVWTGLDVGLENGRRAVARIVGRDVAGLDEAGVARAAIESLAENFSDGVVAPALFMALGGLPAMAVYKAVNTADSMVGHRTTRHDAFGWASARLDDLLNLTAARLSAGLIALASGRPITVWRVARRDAPRHRSPNAGWPEAAMAASLGVRLAGPRAYAGQVVADGWMGDGRDPRRADIGRALRVYRGAWMIGLGLVAGAMTWRR